MFRRAFSSSKKVWAATICCALPITTIAENAAPTLEQSPDYIVVSSQNPQAALNAVISSPQYTLHSPLGNNNTPDQFTVVFDTRTRNPLFVVERLSAANHRKDKLDKKKHGHDITFDNHATPSKRPPFHADNRIDSPHFRVNPKDYNDSKYDRGHMAPAADFGHNVAQYESTFTMANISPQAPILNKNYWARLESWIRHFLLQSVFDEVIVITGPVFAPIFLDNQWVYVHRTVGTFPRLITVPSHYYKVIIGKRKVDGKTLAIGTFLIPNIDTIDKLEPIGNFAVRLEQLESILGYTFLPNILESKEKEILDTIIPDTRDLSNVLNGKHMQSTATNTQDTSSSVVTWSGVGHPMNLYTLPTTSPSQPQTQQKKGSSNNSVMITDRTRQVTKKLSTGNPLVIMHLCDCAGVDCARSMFQ